MAAGLEYVLAANPFYRAKFSQARSGLGVLRSWEEFHALPWTTKEELLSNQESNPPYGTNLTARIEEYIRVHQTTGTSGRRLRWLDTQRTWNWIISELWPEIFEAAEFSKEDRFFFPFSFGPFLGFWAAFEGAQKTGRFVLAGGGMSTLARLELMRDHRVNVVFCTPTYALRMIEVARQADFPLGELSVHSLVLAGEPGASIPSTRARIESAWNARVFDHSGMTEIGSLGLEYRELPGKLFLLENHCIAEFIDPQTEKPVAEGELGELVLTNLGRWDSPLIRYRTGDIVRWRTDARPRRAPYPYVFLDGGILTRADDMLWIKGNNIYPSAIEAVLRECEGIAEYSLEVRNNTGELCIRIEPVAGVDAAELKSQVIKNVQDRLYFKPNVALAEPGTLPRFEMKAQRLKRV